MVGIFDQQLILRAPTRATLDELGADRDFMRTFLAFQWGRQRIGLTEADPRPE